MGAVVAQIANQVMVSPTGSFPRPSLPDPLDTASGIQVTLFDLFSSFLMPREVSTPMTGHYRE